MADMSNYNGIGRLTRDPETTETPKSSVTKFAIAVNGFKKDDVSFIDCEAWGKVGEIVQQHCQKGKQIAVDGRLRVDRWKDNDGNNRSKPIVNVRDITLLGSKDDSAQAPKPKQQSMEIPKNDNIPF